MGYVPANHIMQWPVFNTDMAVGGVTELLYVKSGVWCVNHYTGCQYEKDYHTGGKYQHGYTGGKYQHYTACQCQHDCTAFQYLHGYTSDPGQY